MWEISGGALLKPFYREQNFKPLERTTGFLTCRCNDLLTVSVLFVWYCDIDDFGVDLSIFIVFIMGRDL